MAPPHLLGRVARLDLGQALLEGEPALVQPPLFLLVTFGFSIAWGWLMQKSESLWGSVGFHAGADLLIILPIFSSLGAA